MFTLSKKIIAILLSLAFVFTLSACSDQSQMEGAGDAATEDAAAEPATEESTQ